MARFTIHSIDLNDTYEVGENNKEKIDFYVVPEGPIKVSAWPEALKVLRDMKAKKGTVIDGRIGNGRFAPNMDLD